MRVQLIKTVVMIRKLEKISEELTEAIVRRNQANYSFPTKKFNGG